MSKTQEQQITERTLRFMRVFNSDDGREILYDLMKSSYFLHPTFAPDALTMAFNEGQRSIVMRILQIIETDPEKIMQLRRLGQSEEL